MTTPTTDHPNSKYVKDLRPSDVLFGRGSGPNDHEGNIRFRQLVSERKIEYMATNHRMTKAKIAQEIVDQVFLAHGRFMKKVEPPEMKLLGFDEATDVWEIVGDDTIMEKAKQALRQNTQKLKGSLTSSSGCATGSTTAGASSVTASASDGNADASKQQQSSLSPHHHQRVPPICTSGSGGLTVTTTQDLPVVHSAGFGDFEPLPISPGSYTSSPGGYSPSAQAAAVTASRLQQHQQSLANTTTSNIHPGHMNQIPVHYQQHQQQQHLPSHLQHHAWNNDMRQQQHTNLVLPSQMPHHQLQHQQQLHPDMRRSQMPPTRLHHLSHHHHPANSNNNNNSMLPYARHNSYDIAPQPIPQQQPQRQQQQDASNLSMVEIPDDSVGPPRSRPNAPRHRGSLLLEDLPNLHEERQRRHNPSNNNNNNNTLELNDLMDSFSKMKATVGNNDYVPSKFHASVETMGTIEHINPGSIADMSLGTMGSSTFSLFRGNESLAAMDDKIVDHHNHDNNRSKEQPPTPPPPTREASLHFGMDNNSNNNNHQQRMSSTLSMSTSMSLSDVWGGRRKSSTSTSGNAIMATGAYARDSSSLSSRASGEGSVVQQPQRYLYDDQHVTESSVSSDYDNSLLLGSSSLSVLKAALSLNENENSTTSVIRPQTFYVGDHHAALANRAGAKPHDHGS